MKKCKVCGKEIAHNGFKYIHAKMIHGTMVIGHLPKHDAILDEEDEMYNLKINKKQAEVISKALDLYSRIGSGQTSEMLWHPSVAGKMWAKNDNLNENQMNQKLVRQLLDDIKRIIWGYRPNEHGGITTAEETDKIAYDLHQIIRHKIAWDNEPDGGLTVNFHKPMQYSKEELAKM